MILQPIIFLLSDLTSVQETEQLLCKLKILQAWNGWLWISDSQKVTFELSRVREALRLNICSCADEADFRWRQRFISQKLIKFGWCCSGQCFENTTMQGASSFFGPSGFFHPAQFIRGIEIIWKIEIIGFRCLANQACLFDPYIYWERIPIGESIGLLHDDLVWISPGPIHILIVAFGLLSFGD